VEEDTTTTTEQETVQADESSQPESPETQAVQSEEQSEETTDQTTSDEDAEILEWANKKGVKTDDPIALLKMVREGEKKMHSATNEANALKNTINTTGEEQGYDDTSLLLNRLKVTEFYLNNPEAKALDEDMAEIVNKKPYLADDLETVFELAKARKSTVAMAAAKETGRQEALAQVAQAEKAAPPNASATTRQGVANITDEDIGKMSAQEYLQFKQDHPEFKPFS
jgi:hypothetical protein